MHPRSPEAHSVFGTGALLLCQPSEMVRVAGVAPLWPCASTLLVPNKAVCCCHYTLKNGCQTWTRTKTSGLTGRRATLTLPGNGAAGRIPTCIVPFRRRMPHVFDHGSNLKWSERQDFHLRPPGPKPGALKTELHSEKNGGPEGTCTLSLPADNGLLC